MDLSLNVESHLISIGLGQFRIHLPVFRNVCIHEFLQIHRQKLKYEVELCLLHQHILKMQEITTKPGLNIVPF